MGIGLGMTEARVLDRWQTGKLCNKNWHDYKVAHGPRRTRRHDIPAH